VGLRINYARGLVLMVGLGAAIVGAAVAPGCRTATQVTVELRTVGTLTCAQLKGIGIVVARTPVDAEEKLRLDSLSAQVARGECGADPHLLGTLVITPSEGSWALVVRARVSDALEATCRHPDYKGCIVARRAFSFIDHASVTLPIGLEIECANVPCDVVTSCRSGSCLSSTAVCSESTSTCESDAQPVLGPDGGVVPADGAIPADGGGGSDALPPDASDAAKDAADATTDAPPDAAPGNLCPLSSGKGGPIDCSTQASAIYCCRGPSEYGCGMPGVTPICQAANDKYFCTGRAGCPALSFCCGTLKSVPPYGSACSPSCTTDGDHILCNGPGDCPPEKRFCNGIYFNPGVPNSGGPIRECSAN